MSCISNTPKKGDTVQDTIRVMNLKVCLNVTKKWQYKLWYVD